MALFKVNVPAPVLVSPPVPGPITLLTMTLPVAPMVNRPLYKKIIEDGAVVSEQPLGAHGYKSNFVARNRIIAVVRHWRTYRRCRE